MDEMQNTHEQFDTIDALIQEDKLSVAHARLVALETNLSQATRDAFRGRRRNSEQALTVKARHWFNDAVQNLTILRGQANPSMVDVDRWLSVLGQANYDSVLYEQEYQDYKADFERLEKEQRQAGDVARVQQDIERLWKEAAELENPATNGGRTATAAFLLTNYYSQAQRLAEGLVGIMPDNREALQLQEMARSRREQKAIAADIYTSAVQAELYAQALPQLQILKSRGEKTVPKYDFVASADGGMQEIYVGDVPIEEAEADLRARADKWAGDMVGEYSKQVTVYLNEFNPMAARDLMTQKRKLINEFLTADDRKILDDLTMRINVDYKKYEDAKKFLDDAQKIPSEKLFNAWGIWERAKTLYGGWGEVETVRKLLVDELLKKLQQDVVMARGAFDTRNRTNVAQIIQQIDKIERDARPRYENKDPLLATELKILSDLKAEAVKYQQQLQEVQRLFDQTQRVVESNPAQARTLLTQIEGFDAAVLQELERLTDLRNRIFSQLGDAETLTQLEQQITLTKTLADAEANIKAAQDLVERHDRDTRRPDPRYRALVRDMEQHRDYLQAKIYSDEFRFKEAREKLVQLLKNREHKDHDSAERLQASIQANEQKARRFQAELNAIKKAYRENRLYEAFEMLNTLQTFTTEDNDERERLRDQVQTDLVSTLENGLKEAEHQWTDLKDRFQIDTKNIKIDEVTKALRQLRDVSPARHKYWQERLALLQATGKAWQSDGNTEIIIERSIELWKRALAFVNVEEAQSPPVLVEKYESALLNQERKLLEFQAQRAIAIKDVIGAPSLIDRLKVLMRDFPDDGVLFFLEAKLAWLVATGPATRGRDRESYFDLQKESASGALNGTLPNAADKAVAEKLVQSATRGAVFAKQIHKIETLLTEARDMKRRETIGLLDDAREIRETLLANARVEDFGFVQVWWEGLRDETLSSIKQHYNHIDLSLSGKPSFEHVRPLTLMYLVDSGNREAQDMFELLPNLMSEADGLVNEVESDLHTGLKFPAADPFKKAGDQRKHTIALRENLDTIDDLYVRVARSKDKQLKSKLEEVYGKTGSLRARLYKAFQILDQFIKQVDNIRDNIPEWKKSRNLRAYEVALGQVSHDFHTHALYLEWAHLYEELKKQLSTAQSQMDEIQKALKEENFERIANLLGSEEQKKLYEAFGFHEDFPFFSANNTLFRGSNSVNKHIRKVIEWQRTLDRFAEPFGATELNLIASSMSVVDWDQEKKGIDALRKVGRFSQAQDVVQQVIDLDEERRLGLKKAVERISAPPMPSDYEDEAEGQTPDGLYQWLIQNSVSDRDRGILLFLKDTQMKKYNDWLAKAQRCQTEIERYQTEWLQAWSSWCTSIEQIGNVLADARGVRTKRLKGRALETLNRELENAEKALEQAQRACPDHSKIEGMRTHKLFGRALFLSGRKQLA